MGESTTFGLLSVVGTPIGNLADLSPRVRDTLANANAILCEDTRVTAKLLNYLGIKKPLERCDENVIARKVQAVIERLGAGERVAFVSDAGMPAISDPGQQLVDAALDAGLKVEVIPGPSAVTCAIALSGLSASHFFFEGFLPRKSGARLRRLQQLSAIPGALVIYESPHRVVSTLDACAAVFGERPCALVRELTKVHEECRRGSASQLCESVRSQEEQGSPLKGECVIVVGEIDEEAQPGMDEKLDPQRVAADLLARGLSPSAAAKELVRLCGLKRSAAYDLVLTSRS